MYCKIKQFIVAIQLLTHFCAVMSKLIGILAQDITNLLSGSDDYDLQVTVGEGPSSKTFEAHSVILRARSPYFKTALSPTWAKKHGEKMVFAKPNIVPAVF